MKSCWLKKIASSITLEFKDIEIPTVDENKFLIKARSTSINRGDVLGTIARHNVDTARIGGVDVCGDIVNIGKNVKGFEIGERVIARGKNCFAEYVLIEPCLAIKIPKDFSIIHAAAIPIAYITAWEALIQLGKLKSSEILAIVGASSGVGVACMQLGKLLGAKTIAVTSSLDKIAKLKSIGADECIVSKKNQDFSESILKLTNQYGADIIVNLVGGSVFISCQNSLANFGRIAIVGYVDSVFDTQLNLKDMHGKRQSVYGISNAPLTLEMRSLATNGFISDVLPEILNNKITPIVDKVFQFHDLQNAKDYVETNKQIGKVILTF